MNAEEWCLEHRACTAAVEWCRGKTMQQAWDTAKPDWLIWAATNKGVLDDKSLREFERWCVRQVRNHAAFLVANRAAKRAEEQVAAWASARSAANDSVCVADDEEDREAARDAQAAWIRRNAVPEILKGQE